LALTINGNKLVFNKEVKGGSGVLLGVDIFTVSNDKLVEHAITIISHEQIHEPLGHPHQAIVT
jgi:2-keto-3-deoxy-galactonokinase